MNFEIECEENSCYIDIWYGYQYPERVKSLGMVTPPLSLIKNKMSVEAPEKAGGKFVICMELIDKESKVELGTCNIYDKMKTAKFVNYALAEQLYKMYTDKPGFLSSKYLSAATVPGYEVVKFTGSSLKNLYKDNDKGVKPMMPSIYDLRNVRNYINRKWEWLSGYNFNEDYDQLIVNRLYPDQAFSYIPVCMSYYKVLDRLPKNLELLPLEALENTATFLKDTKLSDKELLYLLIYYVGVVVKKYIKYKEDTIKGVPVDLYSCDALEYGCGDCEDLSYVAYGCFKLIKSNKITIPRRLRGAVKLLHQYSVGCILLYANNYMSKDIFTQDPKRLSEHSFYHMSCCLMPISKTKGLVPLFCDGTISIYPNMFENIQGNIISEIKSILPNFVSTLDMKFTGENDDLTGYIYQKAFVFYSDEVPAQPYRTTFLIACEDGTIGINVSEMKDMKFKLVYDANDDLRDMEAIICKYNKCIKPVKVKKINKTSKGNIESIAENIMNI